MKYLDEEKYEEWHAPNPYAMFNGYAYLIALNRDAFFNLEKLLQNQTIEIGE